MTPAGGARWFRSTRFRITAPATLITAVLVAAGSFFLVNSVRQDLSSQVDQALANGARFVKQEIAARAYVNPTAPRGDYGQVFTAGGRLLGSSSNLLHQPPLIRVSTVGASGQYFTVDNPTYGNLRIYEVQLGGRDSPILVEGASISEISAATDLLELRLMIIAPLLVLAVAVLIWLVVGRAMRPVETMRVKASEISAANLDERIEDPATGDELQDLAKTLNSLLDRVQSALDRERRLVTDASHEFRSPLASMRASIEADIRLARTPPPTQHAMLRGIQRLQDLADQLLVLERSERSAGDVRLVDLDEIVLSEIERVEGMDGVHIDATDLSAGLVLGNELDFSRIVDNLTVNALRHARSTVAFRLHEDEARVSLVVADDGPGIPDGQRALVFEPFFRSDEDRGRNDGGPGLGLAIVSELVAKYNGHIAVEQDEALGGARFQVMFPSARASTTA